MKPRITLITLGVDDLERSLRFYRDGLGLKTEGIVGSEFEHGAVAFFDLQAGLKLALWPREEVDQRLQSIMKGIHEMCLEYGQRAHGTVDYVDGANIAGFVKVAEAMLAQGVT